MLNFRKLVPRDTFSWLTHRLWQFFYCASKQLICIHNVSQNIEETLKQVGKMLACIIAVYIPYDSIIYLYVYACMEILHTAEGEQHTGNAPQFGLVNSWFY